MTAPYYTGDNVPLRFEIYDDEGPITPTQALISIFKPSNDIKDDTASIDGNEVSYTVKIDDTEHQGKYKAYFVLTLPDSLIRTHKIEFDVIANPERS